MNLMKMVTSEQFLSIVSEKEVFLNTQRKYLETCIGDGMEYTVISIDGILYKIIFGPLSEDAGNDKFKGWPQE